MPSKTCLSTTLLFRVSSTLPICAWRPWPAASPSTVVRIRPHLHGPQLIIAAFYPALPPTAPTSCAYASLADPLSFADVERHVASSSAARSRPRIWDGIFRCSPMTNPVAASSPTPTLELKLGVHRYRD